MLKAFEQTWRRTAATPERLRAAVAKLPADAIPIPRFNTPERQARLRDRVVALVFQENARATEISCSSSGCAAYFGGHFELRFDMSPEGVVLTGVATLLQA